MNQLEQQQVVAAERTNEERPMLHMCMFACVWYLWWGGGQYI